MKVESVAVVGAGVMGSGIAQTLAEAGYRVTLHDLRPEAVASAPERIAGGRFGLRAAVERGKLTAEQADAALARVTPTTDLAAACAGVDLVVEAVSEDLGVKLQVFRELDRLAPRHAVLASNTSGFSPAALGAATTRPERVLVWHWASPPPVMKLAEIVVHAGTAPEARDAVVEAARRCGKSPQVVNDAPLSWGFVSNRLFAALCGEADRIVAEGVATPEQVDAIMRDCFRWPVGPFELVGGAGSGWDESSAHKGAESERLARMLMPNVFGKGGPRGQA